MRSVIMHVLVIVALLLLLLLHSNVDAKIELQPIATKSQLTRIIACGEIIGAFLTYGRSFAIFDIEGIFKNIETYNSAPYNVDYVATFFIDCKGQLINYEVTKRWKS